MKLEVIRDHGKIKIIKLRIAYSNLFIVIVPIFLPLFIIIPFISWADGLTENLFGLIIISFLFMFFLAVVFYQLSFLKRIELHFLEKGLKIYSYLHKIRISEKNIENKQIFKINVKKTIGRFDSGTFLIFIYYKKNNKNKKIKIGVYCDFDEKELSLIISGLNQIVGINFDNILS